MRTLGLLLALALPFASAQQGSAPAPSVRTIPIAGGEVVVDGDSVVILDAKGQRVAESWCDMGSYDAYAALFTALAAAVAKDDRASVAKLVRYPLRVNAAKVVTIRSAAELGKDYGRVFTPRVVEQIRKAQPAAVFCRNGQGMLGDGVVWAGAPGGNAKVEVVNQ